jgi:hypothetical protein
VTLVFETLAYFKVYAFPAGVSVSGLSLVASMLVFIVVSLLTRGSEGAAIDPDIRLVMEV